MPSTSSTHIYPFLLVPTEGPLLEIDPTILPTQADLGHRNILVDFREQNGKLYLSKRRIEEATVEDLEELIREFLKEDLIYSQFLQFDTGLRDSHISTTIEDVLPRDSGDKIRRWYHVYALVCPFALVYCSSNEAFVNGLPSGQCLLVPVYSIHHLGDGHRARLEQLYKHDQYVQVPNRPLDPGTSHFFYHRLCDAARVWVAGVIDLARTRWPKDEVTQSAAYRKRIDQLGSTC